MVDVHSRVHLALRDFRKYMRSSDIVDMSDGRTKRLSK